MTDIEKAAEEFKTDRFVSISECARKYNVDRKKLSKYLKENNLYYNKQKQNLSDAVEEILKTPDKERRINKCALKYHVTYKKLADSLHDIGISTENRFEKEKKEQAQKAIKYYQLHSEESMKHCAELFDVSSETLWCEMRKQNIPIHEKYSSTPETKKRIQEAVEEYKKSKTITISECARKHSIERHRLSCALSKLNIKTNEEVIAKDQKGNSFIMKTKKAGKRAIENVSLNENFFEVIDTEEKAYWLGFLLADGSIRKDGNSINIGLSIRDYDHLHRFKRSLNLNAEIKEYKSHVKALDKYYPSCRLSFTSEKIKNDLAKCNVLPQKSGCEKAFKDLPPELFRHYLRGFFDGDGSICEYDREEQSRCQNSRWLMEIVSSQELMQYFFDELTKRGFKIHSPQKCSNSFIYCIRTSNSLEIINIMKFIYSGASIYLPRKYEKASKICRLYSTSIEE